MTESTFVTQSIDHLGIAAGICHKIGLVETIDTFIGPTKRKVSVGQAVTAMILNALGFAGRPPYLGRSALKCGVAISPVIQHWLMSKESAKGL